MMRSMTAFSRVSTLPKDGKWMVEIRSVNNRYLDLSVKLPAALSTLESKVRDMVSAEIKRGKVMVQIGQDLNEEKIKQVSLNEDAVNAYKKLMSKIRKDFQVQGEPSLSDILKLPGIISLDLPVLDAEKSWKSMRKAVKNALSLILRAKEQEGKTLAADVRGRLHAISKTVLRIEKAAAGRSGAVYQKLTARIEQLLGEADKDKDRIYREVAFLAERSDITEEIVRLKSHLELFESKLSADTEVGRELDFLCQELNREINTVGSKSQLFEITTEVVAVKGEIEKIREQVQNIE